jgi:intergrase/recombinase
MSDVEIVKPVLDWVKSSTGMAYIILLFLLISGIGLLKVVKILANSFKKRFLNKTP